ncbi:hypothetical protein BKA59DRAFT_225124 [Fusarium tricinctum]|uniref:Uncharacterized protein n=1 Tax=Fusarium tricinctum TaxID=61284 RepID=A0A8K0RWC1_9HYPO|nr:hypothetical protein BKA59DRAFT_225124 [Fusarium tricinctum]
MAKPAKTDRLTSLPVSVLNGLGANIKYCNHQHHRTTCCFIYLSYHEGVKRNAKDSTRGDAIRPRVAPLDSILLYCIDLQTTFACQVCHARIYWPRDDANNPGVWPGQVAYHSCNQPSSQGFIISVNQCDENFVYAVRYMQLQLKLAVGSFRPGSGVSAKDWGTACSNHKSESYQAVPYLTNLGPPEMGRRLLTRYASKGTSGKSSSLICGGWPTEVRRAPHPRLVNWGKGISWDGQDGPSNREVKPDSLSFVI